MLNRIKISTPLLCCILLIVAYGIWSLWFKPVPTPDTGFVQPKPAVSATKEEGPVVKIKKIPKKKVVDKFPGVLISDDEEFVDTVDLPPAPNGASVLVKTDTVTGETTSIIQNKKAPWFAFEDTNYAGIGIELHHDGELKKKIYYKRDFVRIKDLHLQGEIEGKIGKEKAEGFVGANLEFRF